MSSLKRNSLTDACTVIVIPKTLFEALQQLANEKDIAELRTTVYERICEIENEEPLDLPTGESVDLDWSEGTEHFKDYTIEHAQRALGFIDDTIPSFNRFLDPGGEKTYWNDKGWFDDETNVKIICAPRWHQLIGMLALVDAMFNGKNILLMDEVGLGKTMQVAGAIAIITFFREYHDRMPEGQKSFPGMFSKCVEL